MMVWDEANVISRSYDCMYMTANNQFYTQGDGGFINVSRNTYPPIAIPVPVRLPRTNHVRL